MKIRHLMLIATVVATPALARGSHSTRSYFRSNGTFVQSSRSTNADRTKLNNYSTQGNYNPYSGRVGTVNPYQPTTRNPLGSPFNNGYRQ